MGQEARSNRLVTCIEEQAKIGGGEALFLMDFDRRGPFAREPHPAAGTRARQRRCPEPSS